MFERAKWWIGLATVAAAACGGTVEHVSDPDAGMAGSAGFGGSVFFPDATPDAMPDSKVGPVEDVVSDYVDPGCPDADPLPPEFACDPLAEVSGCEPGDACYPYTEYPEGDGCGFERHRADCFPAGPLGHGQRCGGGFGSCAAGLLCVIGAQSSARCAPICDPVGPSSCSGGLICLPVDVEGIGACG